jgi:2-polyprenyl-6-methoxyphenol hydroxylase-like FAD-dependent oxidoreductase
MPRLLPLLAALLLSPLTAPGQEPEPIRCELAVIGGGSGGFGAALAAARLGVDVVLVERSDKLGGNSVRGGVNIWEPGLGGTAFPFEIYRRLKREPQAVGIYSMARHLSTFDPAREAYRFPGGETVIDPARGYLDSLQRHGLGRSEIHGVVFEPEAMAKTMLAMLEETGHCRVLFRTEFKRVAMNGSRIQSVTVQKVRFAAGGSRMESRTLVADFFVDATGDGLVCEEAGCAMMTGQEPRAQFDEPGAPEKATARVNGVSLLYRVTPAATPAVEPLPEGIAPECWWAKKFPVAQISTYPNGDRNVNMLPTMEGAEFMELGWVAARRECERRVRAHWHDLQTRCAEFRGYRIESIAPVLGVRETKRVIGEYVLTQHDLDAGISGQKHADLICLADHPCDTHGGHNQGIKPLREPYGVPFRCLIPQGTRNLLIACRAASFSSIAASSCRLSRTMMQLGQAAGTAVALAKEWKVQVPDVPPERLRASLRGQHVQLEHPMPAALRTHLQNE